MGNERRSFLPNIVLTLLILGFALTVATAMSPDTLNGWASLILVAMVPSQIVTGLLYRYAYPRWIAERAQPWRGIAFLLITMATGVVVAAGALDLIHGGLTTPTPFEIMYLILSVPVTVTLVVVFQGWPFTSLFRNPALQGLAVLCAAYGLAWLLFRALFNFSFAAQAPFYHEFLDPKGLFVAWYPLAASLDVLVFILLLVFFDFWPVSVLARALPALRVQPFFGLASGGLVLLSSAALWMVCIHWLQMDIVLFMVNVCVAMIFGIFILLIMFEGMPGLNLLQPWRGVVLTGAAIILARLMLGLYGMVVERVFHLSGGRPPYDLELWLASSMLAVTFPSMVFFAQYFQFWPFRGTVEQRESGLCADPAGTTGPCTPIR